MAKPNHYREILQTLERLYKSHPSYNIGRHISTATNESDLWGVSDKEFLLLLKKYEVNLDMDGNHNDDELDKIINDGMHLGDIFDNDEEEEY